MTHATMALAEMAEKGPAVDMLRQMVQFAAQRPMDGAEHEVMLSMDFPRAHGLRIHRRNPLERLNVEIRRRTHVVGLFPNDAAITRLVGAMLLEQNDEWSLNRRHMRLEGLQSLSDAAPTRGPAFQRGSPSLAHISLLRAQESHHSRGRHRNPRATQTR